MKSFLALSLFAMSLSLGAFAENRGQNPSPCGQVSCEEQESDIIGSTGSSFTVRLQDGRIYDPTLEIWTGTTVSKTALDYNSNDIIISKLPQGVSWVRVNVYRTPPINSDVSISIGQVTAGGVQLNVPPVTLDCNNRGDCSGYVELFGK